MHDTPLVGMPERVRQLLAVAQHLLDWERSLREAGAQRLPLDQLHGDVGLALGFADLVDRADVRMVQLRGEARFLDQAGSSGLVGQGLGGQDLQCDIPVELLVMGAIDHAHATGAKLLENPVMAERLTNHRKGVHTRGRHRRGRPPVKSRKPLVTATG
jgi:hypothetical protein